MNHKTEQLRRADGCSFMRRTLWTFLSLAFWSTIAIAQGNTIVGVVTDSSGETLIGVSVVVKGTTTGAITDGEGRFQLLAKPGEILSITYIGMVGQEVKVGSSTTLSVELQEDKRSLEEVVVVGYGVAKKKDITTAVTTVTSEDINARPIVSALQAIQGKAAGVQVIQPSGKPGAGLSMRIRGGTSISASSEPVYVVDGIIATDIQNLNPTDIESMQILKDASSAAIYGSRAANGVVLITTKKGKAGDAKIELNAYGGFSNIDKKLPTLNTSQYRALMEEVIGPGTVPLDETHYTDWHDEIFKTGVQQNYQLTISGGSDKFNYYVSGGYQNEKGIIAPANYERYSFRTNLSGQIKKWLKLSTNLSYSHYTRRDATDNTGSTKGGILMSILNTPPYLPVWDKDHPGQYASNPFNAGWENPVAAADKYNMNTDDRFMGNIGLDVDIYKGLKFRTTFSLDYSSHRYENFVDPIKTSYGRQKNGLSSAWNDNFTTWLNENILSYDQSWGKHTFSALAGFTVQQYYKETIGVEGEDFVKGIKQINQEYYTLNWANKITNGSTSKEWWSLVSALARVHYNYDSKYLVTVNFRADGSSKLHPDHRWGYFPSGSAGWRISAEEFFEPARDVVDDLKLRVGWGVTGSQEGIGLYDYMGQFGISRVETSGNGPSIYRSSMANPDLTWETTTQTNVGIDLSMWNARVVLALDGYYKQTDNLLIYVPLPDNTGFNSILRNSGQVVNKGIEFELTTQNLIGAFKWETQLNMSFNDNKVQSMGLANAIYGAAQGSSGGTVESVGQTITITRPGLPMGSFFGYVSEGVDPETGDIKYADLNSNGYLDPEDRKVIGCAQPIFSYGMTNTFGYRGFTLSFMIQGTYGNQIFNASRIDTEGMFDSKNQSVIVLDRWMRPGMETSIPRAGNVRNGYVSSRFVEDGSYLRLKTATLSYSFPKDWIRKLYLTNLTLFATGNNLFTITSYSGYDPEVNQGGGSNTVMGIDYGTYPQARSFVFGLNVQF